MPTTKKQKKAKKSRELDLLSDIGNMDIKLGGNHFERDESEFSNSVRRSESPSYETLLERTKSGILPDMAIFHEELNLAVK